MGLWRMASRSVVVVGCGFVDVGLWLWDCGSGKCGVVGLWRMAGQSLAVFGCGFVGVGLWVWDCGGGVISLWRW